MLYSGEADAADTASVEYYINLSHITNGLICFRVYLLHLMVRTIQILVDSIMTCLLRKLRQTDRAENAPRYRYRSRFVFLDTVRAPSVSRRPATTCLSVPHCERLPPTLSVESLDAAGYSVGDALGDSVGSAWRLLCTA